MSQLPLSGGDNPLTLSQEVLPRHPGFFFEQSPRSLRRIARGGYQAIGIASVLLNSAGEVLMVDHKGNNKLADHTLGITSETLGGFYRHGHVHAEPIVQSIGRCLVGEVNIDLSNATVTLRRERHYELSDWPIGTATDAGRLLGVDVGLLLDDATAMNAEGEVDSPEIYRSMFVDPKLVMRGKLGEIRPGTIDCLHALDDAGLLDPNELRGTELIFPALVAPDFDIDLRRLAA